MRPRPENREPFVKSISLDFQHIQDVDRFPFTLPIVKDLDGLALHPAVTFFVGENGSGKSTLLESIAVRLGIRETGGEKGVRMDVRPVDGGLHDAIRLHYSRFRKPADRLFMRAETVYELATALDADHFLRDEYSYGDSSLHMLSHGETFLAIVQNRMRKESIFIMDEPESALSPSRQLTMLKEIDWLVRTGGQFLIATHSPILMAYPDAMIYELSETGISETTLEDTEHFQLTKSFLNCPQAFLRHLIE